MADDHLIPNTTQVPNSILDLLMPFLHDGEARVLLYLCRRTYGFQRESDSVSLEQFVSGIRTEGRQLDFGAGISRQGAMNALAVLKGIGIVEQLEGGRGRGNVPVFRINRKCEMVKLLDLIAQDPENPREKIAQNLDLIRQKSLPYGPFHKKAKNDKPSRKKVEILDLSEKVKSTQKKGLTVRPTKPSNTKPRKDIPPVSANAETSPTGDAAAEGTGKRGCRLPTDWTPTAEDLAWAQQRGYHTLLNLEEHTEEFQRHWWSQATKNTKLDWSMTWKNRIQLMANQEKHRRQLIADRRAPKPPITPAPESAEAKEAKRLYVLGYTQEMPHA